MHLHSETDEIFHHKETKLPAIDYFTFDFYKPINKIRSPLFELDKGIGSIVDKTG